MSRWKIAAAALAASWSSAPAHAATSVSLPGSFNTEIGCASDWDPTCAQAQLSTLGSGLWYGAYHFPTGSYEYKVAYDQDWTVNYGAGGVLNGPNMSLDVTDPATVYFRHNETTRLTDAQLTPFGPMVVSLPGSFNSEFGCAGDWDPACSKALMILAADGFWYATHTLPGGSYEYKVAYDLNWNENYGAGGVPNGPNLSLDVLESFATVYFRYDQVTHLATAQFTPFGAAGAVPEPSTWAMMLVGFGALGCAMRRRRRLLAAA